MRYARFIFGALALTALLCVFTLAVRSFWRCDTIYWGDGQRRGGITSSGGRLNFTYENDTRWPTSRWPMDLSFSSSSRNENPPHWEEMHPRLNRGRLLGFEYTDTLSRYRGSTSRFPSPSYPSYLLIALPYWFIGLLIVAVAAGPWAVRIYRYRSRLRRNLCPECGYNLRATPHRCPECGWAAVTAPAAANRPGEC